MPRLRIQWINALPLPPCETASHFRDQTAESTRASTNVTQALISFSSLYSRPSTAAFSVESLQLTKMHASNHANELAVLAILPLITNLLLSHMSSIAWVSHCIVPLDQSGNILICPTHHIYPTLSHPIPSHHVH